MTRRGEAGFLNNSCRNRIHGRLADRPVLLLIERFGGQINRTERAIRRQCRLDLAGRRAAAPQCYRYSRWHAVQGVCHSSAPEGRQF
jgi:hypothetical protein